MAARLSFLARGKGPLPPAKIKWLQSWIEEEWESEDLDEDLVKVLQRLLLTINRRADIMGHVIEALQGVAAKKCHRRNCGTVCLCGPCHARKALEVLDPDWRAR